VPDVKDKNAIARVPVNILGDSNRPTAFSSEVETGSREENALF
jgi:hypothetical protein